jgi:hypothetical protein
MFSDVRYFGQQITQGDIPMYTRLIVTALGFVLAMEFCPQIVHADHHDGGPRVLQEFAVEVAAKDRPAVLGRLKELQEILSKEGQPRFRVWQGSYAGSSVGMLFITIERQNFADFGVNQSKVMASSSVNKWIEDMNNSGLSKLVGQSLLTEVTP